MLQAQELLRRGCLWNTFVTAGCANTFLDVLCTGIPNIVLAINNALAYNNFERAYQAMPDADLAREVFAHQPHRLLTIRDAASGWTDLGSPTRVMEILARSNSHPTWWQEERESVSLPRPCASDNPGQDVTDAPLSSEKEPKQ